MPKYRVWKEYRGTLTYEIKADNEDEAYERAEEIWDLESLVPDDVDTDIEEIEDGK